MLTNKQIVIYIYIPIAIRVPYGVLSILDNTEKFKHFKINYFLRNFRHFFYFQRKGSKERLKSKPHKLIILASSILGFGIN